ncbi:MAG TPA: YHS domain-containing protein [Gemmatimonadales bacterium]|nr:YHS domain-containing protein [Gemmatimonadales bacterium]
MDRVQDPVCGMMVDPDSAAASATHGSREFFFCSDECRRLFEADPEVYAAKAAPEPVLKFGSAGSGGLEHEPYPTDDPHLDGQIRPV